MALIMTGPHPEHHAKAVDVDLLVAARAHQQLRRCIRKSAARRAACCQVAGVHDARQPHVRCRSHHTPLAAYTPQVAGVHDARQPHVRCRSHHTVLAAYTPQVAGVHDIRQTPVRSRSQTHYQLRHLREAAAVQLHLSLAQQAKQTQSTIFALRPLRI